MRNRVSSAIHRWWNTPASPLMFWRPRSGMLGGLILGAVLYVVYKLVVWVL